jgi:hypothetical protein
MIRHALQLLLILAVPVWLLTAAVAQENGGTGPNTDAPATEGRDGASSDATPSGREGTVAPDRGDATATKTEKQADRKKKTARKPAAAEEKQKEAPAEEAADDGIGENLLLVDHEKIKYDRIPGITIKADDQGDDSIVNIPEDKIGGENKKEKESAGIFGKNTRAIAGWGIVILIFILFVIYSKTRSRKSKRRVVRTVPKR